MHPSIFQPLLSSFTITTWSKPPSSLSWVIARAPPTELSASLPLGLSSTAACVILLTRKPDHISPLLITFQWLPSPSTFLYVTHKALTDASPFRLGPPLPTLLLFFFFFFSSIPLLSFLKEVIYFWLHWIIIAMCGFSLVVVRRGYSLIVEHRLSCPKATKFNPGLGIEPVSLRWQENS